MIISSRNGYILTRRAYRTRNIQITCRSFDPRLDNLLYIRPGGVDKRTKWNSSALLRNLVDLFLRLHNRKRNSEYWLFSFPVFSCSGR